MGKLTIELTHKHSLQRWPCSFCGRAERDTHYSLIEDGEATNWRICEECFTLSKSNKQKALEKAIKYHKKRLKAFKNNIQVLEHLLTQDIEVT